jgi:glycosyltransferase involved in cell wall biosynthesis
MSAAESSAPSADLPSVLIVHNHYRQVGGEDVEVLAEIDLLRSINAPVHTMLYDSRDEARIRRLMRRPDELVFNRQTYDVARGLIRRHTIRVVHCHNLVPLLSTSIYAAAAAEGVPVVQSAHNYRMACLNGLHLRDGAICERCRPGRHAAGIALGCYRDSRAQSLAFGLAQTINSWRGAWRRPTLFVVPTAFSQRKLIGWGIPAEKVVVKPYFVPHDPGAAAGEAGAGEHALFLGRLSVEKGLDLLLDAWGHERLPLVIAGDGPLRAHLERRARLERKANVRFVGHQDRAGVHALLARARFLVMPSIWYETLGLVLLEAYAHGVPVIATRLGAMAEIVRDRVTGLLFTLNDRADLSAKLTELESDTALVRALGAAARHEYEARYSSRANAEQLRAIYARALGDPDNASHPSSQRDLTPTHG